MASRLAVRRLLNLSHVLRRCPATMMIKPMLPPTTTPLTQAPQLLRVASFHSSSRLNNQNIINIQDEDDFKKRVMESETPVVVDFHAAWCGPCKMLGPRLESMIAAKEGAVVLAKVDIDENSDLAMGHGVQAVPTVLAVKGGQVVDKFVGMKDDDSLQSFIDGLQS